MGRIKTALVKRITHELIELHGNKLTDDFEKNKQIIDKLVETHSKKLRNIIAGYATNIIKKKKED